MARRTKSLVKARIQTRFSPRNSLYRIAVAYTSLADWSDGKSYLILIAWSRDDQVFIAEVPKLPGCMAHADTFDEALENAVSSIDNWIKTAKELGRNIPA